MLARRQQQLLFTLLGLLVIALFWVLLRSVRPQEIVLPDGRSLRILQVTWGTKHEFVYGKLWFRMLAAVTPPRWRSKLPVRIMGQSSPTPSLVVWGEWTLPGTNGPARTLVVQDKKWDESLRVFGSSFWINGSNRVMMSWSLDNFPRRLRSLSLAIAEWDQSGWKSLAEFNLANPIRDRFRKWRPEAFPATRSREGAEFTIANLCQQPFISSPWVTWFRHSEIATGSTGVFQVKDNRAGNWRVDRMTVEDASGNRLTSRPVQPSVKVGDFILFGIDGPLWSNENAWKVKADFVRASAFHSNEICSIKGLPVPAAGTSTQLLANAEANGIRIIGVELQWRGRGVRPYRMNQDIEIEPLLPQFGNDDVIILAEVRDEMGRSLPFERSHYTLDPFHFGIELFPDSRTLDLTFAMQKRLSAEWTVRVQH